MDRTILSIAHLSIVLFSAILVGRPSTSATAQDYTIHDF